MILIGIETKPDDYNIIFNTRKCKGNSWNLQMLELCSYHELKQFCTSTGVRPDWHFNAHFAHFAAIYSRSGAQVTRWWQSKMLLTHNSHALPLVRGSSAWKNKASIHLCARPSQISWFVPDKRPNSQNIRHLGKKIISRRGAGGRSTRGARREQNGEEVIARKDKDFYCIIA
jgi:hypothetical protein